MTDFAKVSYKLHEEQYEKKEDLFRRLEKKDTIDFWRHERMYSLLLPLLQPNEKWLTIGDGLGTDANWLETKNVDVIASDIADSALIKAKEKGYIKKYAKINSEKIDLDSNSLDFILCKEAYHHFPRPYMAMYEMLRVAKKGLILIEPQDIGIQMPAIIFLKNILDRINPLLINKFWKNRFSFETVGNYVYKISERELEKLAMGINLGCIAFRGLNDYHSNNLDFFQPKTNKKIFNIVKRKIGFKNLLSKMGIIPYSLLCCIIFKNKPEGDLLDKLTESGYKVIPLPKNPYLKNNENSITE